MTRKLKLTVAAVMTAVITTMGVSTATTGVAVAKDRSAAADHHRLDDGPPATSARSREPLSLPHGIADTFTGIAVRARSPVDAAALR